MVLDFWSEVSKVLQRAWENGCTESISKSSQAVAQQLRQQCLFWLKNPSESSENKLKTPWKELFAYSVFQCTVHRREVERYTHVYIYNRNEILRWIDLFYEAYPGSWSHIFKNQPKTCAELTISQENYLLLIPTVVEVQQTFFFHCVMFSTFSSCLCQLLDEVFCLKIVKNKINSVSLKDTVT